MAEQHRAGVVLIEDSSAGTQLIQELRREGFARIEAIKADRDKVMRMAAQTPRIEAGSVFLPREAPWLHDYLHEMAMFPKGRHDDQVDATAQALAHIGQPNSADAMIGFLRLLGLRDFGLTPEDLEIVFDHTSDSAEFKVRSARKIGREADGFFHATRDEWNELKHHVGITLIEDQRERS